MARAQGFPDDWLVPDWPAPAGVRAVFTTRSGGASARPFDSFNLGDHVRDAPEAVSANRAQLSHALGAHPTFLSQVHGTDVIELTPGAAHGTRADACLTRQAGLACTIMVADCLPVLFAHPGARVVAAAHAGWRGLAGDLGAARPEGVLESTMAAFIQAVQAQTGITSSDEVAQQTLVWLGPCIGPKAFEVGAEVRQVFLRHQAQAIGCFVGQVAGPQGGDTKYLADLAALARLRLAAMGVHQVFGNDGSDAWCTVSNDSRFFSHRRDAARLGSTGRMAACIWLD